LTFFYKKRKTLDPKKASFIVIFVIAEYLLKNSALITCMMTMSAKLKKLLVISTVTALLLSLAFTNLKIAFSNYDGGKIDLFTQKEPYSGKGSNMPSDAFGPEEIVILYALVTYNEIPVQGSMVAFYVTTPSNKSFGLSAETDLNGIATVNFTILMPPINISESEVFGKWLAQANVLIDADVFQDALSFKVDYIVKLLSVRTIDENLIYKTKFGIGGDVGVEISLRSIAMVVKSAMIAIAVKDELAFVVNFSKISDFRVQANEKLVLMFCKLSLPKYAHVGNATVHVSALTAPADAGGVPYCPGVTTGFYILPDGPIKVTFHDVAVVDVTPSAKSVEVGQSVNVSALVQNEGTVTETFAVSAYYDNILIETIPVTLAAYSHANLNFTFETSTISPENYTITVSIPYLMNEADLSDNFYVDGVIEVRPKLPAIVHNIAIVGVTLSNSSLYIGELLQINVTVVNKGTETETFNVGAYYDSSLIGTLQVTALTPNTHAILVFEWDTSSLNEGFYQISASAPLPSDIDVSDNTFIDGIVQLKTKPSIMFHDVAVLNVIPSSISAYKGETITLYVVVKNEGTYVESFNVTAFYNSSVIKTLFVDSLESEAERSLVFYWNTENVPEGNYTPSALASVVPDEENVENNLYVDGIVEVKFPPLTYLLNITSSPILNVNFTINGTPAKTPYSATHMEGVHTVDFPHEWIDSDTGRLYIFSRWEDNSTNRTRIIDLVSDMMLTAYYEEAVSTYTLSITSDPILGVDFTIDGVGQTTPYSALLEEKSYTIVMPSSVTDSETGRVYNFREWEDGSTNLTRIVLLDRDTNLTAYYEAAITGWFVPDWFYWFLPLSLVLIIALLIILFYRRRRKKEEDAFYSGWTAWYYCYDLRSKIPKT